MRPSVTRTLITTAAPQRVYDYLSDFRNAEEWDLGTQSCSRVVGDGSIGTTYRNVSVFMGKKSEILYTATELESPTRIHLVGRNEEFEGHDVFGIRAHPMGSEVTYHAEFAFTGPTKYAAPFVAAYLPSLAKKTLRQLTASLDALGDKK